MLKCAFIIIFEGVTPKTYSTVYKNEECYCLVAGVKDREMGKRYVRKLVELDFTVINLCSEFEKDTAQELQEEAGDGVKIRCAQYAFDELVQLNQVRRLRNYGVIIKLPGVERPQESVIRGEKYYTRVMFVGDIRQAKNAAKHLVQKRVDLIELSTWFDMLRKDTVVKAIDYAIPAGTCGDLNMRDLED